jgi:predicted DNA-binding transcriptional regulator AlpA
MPDLSDLHDFSDLPEALARRRVLTTKRAAAFVGRSVDHWERLHRAGKVPPPIRLGARALGWRVGDLVDWLDACEQRKPAA